MNDEDRKDLNPESVARSRAADGEDVEGHAKTRATGDDMDPDGAKTRGGGQWSGAIGDDDVEGHGKSLNRRATEGDEDVEGHAKTRATTDEEDVEGHGLLLDTDFYINRKMGREAELEREARERRQAKEARPNKPDRG